MGSSTVNSYKLREEYPLEDYPTSQTAGQDFAVGYGWQVDPYVAAGDFDNWKRVDNGIKWADTSDQLNTWRAERSNYFNMLQWQQQNAWNKDMWDLENQYNSPKQQMQRYLDAGINPIWAMSNPQSGQAQQLTSATPAPNQSAVANLDADKMLQDRLIATETNAMNSQLGFGNLDLGYKRLNLDTRISKSTIRKTQAETDVLKSQLESNEFVNKINSATYGIQVNLKIEELNQVREQINNLKKAGELTDSQKALLKAQEDKENALKLQIEAATKKVESETFDALEVLKMKWYELQTARIQANAAQTGANAAIINARTGQQNAATADAALNHQIEKDQDDLKLKSTEQILKMLEMQQGWLDKMLGSTSNFAEMFTSGTEFVGFDRVLSKVTAAYNVLTQRCYTNPTKANLDALDKVQKTINKISKQQFSLPGIIPTYPSNGSYTNPAYPSDSWLP